MKPDNKQIAAYLLVFDGNLFDDKPSLMNPVSVEDHGFNQWLLESGDSQLDGWPRDFMVHVRGSEPVDYCLAGPYYQLVSTRFADAVRSTCGASEVEFLPARVIFEKHEHEPLAHWVLNVRNILDALDWEQTAWAGSRIPYNDPQAHLDVLKPAFKLDAIRGSSIFQLRIGKTVRNGVYVCPPLKRILERARATLGLEFQPIKGVGN